MVLAWTLIAWKLAGRGVATFTLLGLLLVDNLGLWQATFETFALIVSAEVISSVLRLTPWHLAARNDPGRSELAAVSGPHADHAGLRVPNSGSDVFWFGSRSRGDGDRRLCPASPGPAHEPGDPPGADGPDRSGRSIRLKSSFQLLVKVQLPVAYADDHGRNQPIDHAGPFDGRHLCHDRCRQDGRGSAARHPAS